jgi:hypothetical protein
VVLIAIAALCWTITGANRSRHLVMMISACRGNVESTPDTTLARQPERQPWLLTNGN